MTRIIYYDLKRNWPRVRPHLSNRRWILDVPGLSFVENNGRGTIAFGKCERV